MSQLIFLSIFGMYSTVYHGLLITLYRYNYIYGICSTLVVELGAISEDFPALCVPLVVYMYQHTVVCSLTNWTEL